MIVFKSMQTIVWKKLVLIYGKIKSINLSTVISIAAMIAYIKGNKMDQIIANGIRKYTDRVFVHMKSSFQLVFIIMRLVLTEATLLTSVHLIWIVKHA